MKLHNTLSGRVEDFTPLTADTVTLYTCGPTVYSEPHVGNWVAYLRWDILVRTLLNNGYAVNRVMNITDVGHLTSDADDGEDKMIKGAKREGITEWEIADRYTTSFLDGMAQLNLIQPEHVVKATDHIDIQVELVKKLEERGYTYILTDGVYFDTARFVDYANFAHLDLDAQLAGARVAQTAGKRNPSDFVLWRLTPAGETRTMEWDSPWGRGIPGWHIECSAMAMKYLGETIDIHTGGIDHIPVHHTNEIAQSEAASGKPFARYWLHTNFITVGGTKISKSLDNGYTLADLTTKGYSPMDFRMFILQSHYQTESNFTWDNLSAARNRLAAWRVYACLRHQNSPPSTGSLDTSVEAVSAALNADLATPEALIAAETAMSSLTSRSDVGRFVEHLDAVLGLKLAETTPDIDDEIRSIIAQRTAARANKDWDLSDTLRIQLASKNIGINDNADTPVWFWL